MPTDSQYRTLRSVEACVHVSRLTGAGRSTIHCARLGWIEKVEANTGLLHRPWGGGEPQPLIETYWRVTPTGRGALARYREAHPEARP